MHAFTLVTKLLLDVPFAKGQSDFRFSNLPFSLLFSWFFVRHFRNSGPSCFFVCVATASKENDNEQTRPYFLEKT
jgi:hypothetical protein